MEHERGAMESKSWAISAVSLISTILSVQTVYAICPVCTVATCLGLGFSKRLGIDDSITGLWIGGLIASTIAWTVNFLTRHGIRFFGRKPLVAGGYLTLFIGPLYYYKYIGVPGNTLWGYDKLMLGIVVGIVTFTIGCLLYAYLKKHNGNRAYFPFQKVLMPVGLLAIMSFIFYCITR